MLDPIFSLRRRITIPPNQRFQFALVTVAAESREAVIRLDRALLGVSHVRACLRDGVDPFAT